MTTSLAGGVRGTPSAPSQWAQASTAARSISPISGSSNHSPASSTSSSSFESDFFERFSATGASAFFPFRLRSLKLDSVTQPWKLVALFAPDMLGKLTVRAPKGEWHPPPDLSRFSRLQFLELEHRASPNEASLALTTFSALLGERYLDIWAQNLPISSPSTEHEADGVDSRGVKRLLDFFPDHFYSLPLSSPLCTPADGLERLRLEICPPRLRLKFALMNISKDAKVRTEQGSKSFLPPPLRDLADLLAAAEHDVPPALGIQM